MISLDGESDPFRSFSQTMNAGESAAAADNNSQNQNQTEASSLSLDNGSISSHDSQHGNNNDDENELVSHHLSTILSCDVNEDFGGSNSNNMAAGGARVGDGATTAIPSKQFRKSSLRSRWIILALACVVMTGSYYAYDIPSALHQQLQDYMPPSSSYETNFNLLYTVYSIPNVILPLFGGTFVDRHGAPLCLTVFAATVCAGAILLSIGVANKSWEVMYLGRFVFGLGAESLCVAQSTIVSDWFEGKEVAFAMGVGLAVSRLGSIWNNIISPKVANNGGGIEAAFWIGALMTFSSLLMSGMIVFVDKRATKRLKKRIMGGEALQSLTVALLEDEQGQDGVARQVNGGHNPILSGGENNAHSTNNNACTAPVESGAHITDIKKFGPLFWLLTLSCFVVYGCVLPFNNVASGLLLERNFFTSSPTDCNLEHPKECTVGYLQPGTNDALDINGDVCTVDPSQAPVLPLSINHSSQDSERSSEWEETSYTYQNLTRDHVDCGDPFWLDACTNDYCQKQNDATEHAGKVMSIPYLISAISSPPLGHLVDKFGRRAQIAVLSSSLLFLVHFTLAVAASSPVGPLVGQGIAYSLYAAVLWPSVPLTVPKQYTGTAFGVITSIQNIGLAVFPLVIAAIYNASGGKYIPNVEFFFMACAAAGVVVGIFMNRLDRRHGNKLNKASSENEEEEEEEEEELVFSDSIREDDGGGEFAAIDEDDEYFSPLMQS